MMKDTGILIVEDEVITSLHLRSLLEKNHYKVIGTVSSGSEAVSVSLDKRPDIIIMDVGLSGEMTGIDAANIIRATYKPWFLFMTGYQDTQVMDSIGKIENSHVIIKPVKTFEINEILNRFSSGQKSDGL